MSPPRISASVSLPASPTRVRLVYNTDIHGNYPLAARNKTGMDYFTQEGERKGYDVLRLNAGDTHTGMSPQFWPLNIRLNELFRFDSMCLGNHEALLPLQEFAGRLLEWGKTAYLGTTLKKPLDALYKQLLKAGLIKTTPLIVSKANGQYGFISIHAPAESIQTHSFGIQDRFAVKKIAAQAQKLKAQGVKLVILMSHRGYRWDAAFTQSVQANDIDVIMGGHSHTRKDTLRQGKTVFTKPNGKPLLVLNAGAFADKVGVADIVVGENGIHFKANKLHAA